MDTELFMDHMNAHMGKLIEDGDLDIGHLHDDDDTPFIIMRGWSAVYKLNTLLAIEAGCYNKYAHAIATADQYDKHGLMTYHIIPGPEPVLFPDEYLNNEHTADLIDDLRLGTDDRYPSDGHTPYQIPEPLNGLVDLFWETHGDFGFDDEYDFCAKCHKIIKTSPDGYCWTPDYIESEDGYVHVDCCDVDDVLAAYKNRNKALPIQIQKRSDLVELSDIEYSNGFFEGQDDDPKIIIKAMKKAGIDCWFNVEPSQFYVDFTVLVKPEDEQVARRLLSNLSAYQGYSTSEEMSKALRGEHSDFIQSKTYLVSQQDFIDGNLPKE